MSGYNNYGSDAELYEDDRPGNGGGLRKMLEEALAENKKLLDRLNKTDRDKTVSDLLSAMELDPAIAGLIPSDADPQTWLTEKAHLFGKAAPEAPQMERPDLDKDVEVVVHDNEDSAVLLEQQRSLEMMSRAQQSGTPAHAQNDLLDQLNKFEGSQDDLIAWLARNGAPGSF